MNSVPTLETDRLILEKLGRKHMSLDYLSWLNDKGVYQYLETGGNYSYNELMSFLESSEDDKNLLFWAILTKEDGKHIGNIKIDPVNLRHYYAEYGILMGDKKSWGRGYAKEASVVVINYCFEFLKLRKVNLGVVADNVKAVKLYHKLGFVQEGLFRFHGIYNDKLCDQLRMSLFNPEFLNKMDV